MPDTYEPTEAEIEAEVTRINERGDFLRREENVARDNLRRIHAAVLAEREACAKEAEHIGAPYADFDYPCVGLGIWQAAMRGAAAIRSRSKEKANV